MTNTFLRESTKFRVSPAPTEAPGTCASCGSSDQETRDFIDWGMTLDYYGVVYFCTFCFDECANALGYLSPEQSRELEGKLQQALQTIIEFNTKDRALNDAISLLRDSGLFDLVDKSSGTTDEVSSEDLNESPDGNNSGTNESKSNPNEQVNKQGSDDVSAARDDGSIESILRL